MVNKVPEGWKQVALAEIADRSAQTFDPTTNDTRKYVSLEHITPGRRTIDIFGDSTETKSTKTVFTSSDVLFGKLRPYLKKVALPKQSGVCSTDIFALSPKRSVASEFLYALMADEKTIQFAVNNSRGTKMPRTSWKALSKLEVLLPPLPEQKKIAAILSSVDEAIEATEAVIEQTRTVKKGLLQDLLTRGIGHTEFKKTAIGEIPKGWTVVKLDNIATRGSGHTPSKGKPEYWDGDIKWVSLTDSSKLDRVYIFDTNSTISPAGVENSSARLLPKGTVFVSRDAGVGKSAIMASPMAVSQHFIAWICGSRLNNIFLYYWLQSQKNYMETIATGSTIKTIGLTFFKKWRIALPGVEEQKRIATTLLNLDKSIWSSEQQVSQLNHLKRGLLQDLLTGKVRVNNLDLPALLDASSNATAPAEAPAE